ncbi:MAG: bifunctional chorismate mutase/prephenate dehydrogenase [Phycisphaerae bacterium]
MGRDPEPNKPAEEKTRPLSVLRAMIDSIDHDVLQLLAKRNALVGEIAEFKRTHRRRIRDLSRERELLSDRRDRAMPLGLSPEMIESMFRLILWASRDRQATLKAEVPVDVEPRTVAIIGGKGGMGKCFANLFGDLGHAVMIADVDTQLSSKEAASVADVVVISVPIEVTADVIRELGPLVKKDGLLIDVCSVKTEPLKVMLEHCKASVVGTHPLFGPSVHSLQGQRLVITPGRGDEWLAWLKSTFEARGLELLETTAERHDKAMAIVQVLTHFSTEVMGKAMARLGVPIDETLLFTSPIYLMEMFMTARHFAQSPRLYGSIQMANPETPAVTAAYIEAAEALRKIATAKDRDAFEQTFDEVRAYFGEFTEQAMAQSDFLIDRIVERT